MNRAAAVTHAIREMTLEGFVFTPDELAMWDKVAAGELSLEDLLDNFIRFDEMMRQKYPERYAHEAELFRQKQPKE